MTASSASPRPRVTLFGFRHQSRPAPNRSWDSASGDARRIDRARRRHTKINSPPTKIERIELKVPSGTRADGQDKKTPQDGLRGKFSIYHAIASRAGRGRGRGEAIQRPAADPTVVALRRGCSPRLRLVLILGRPISRSSLSPGARNGPGGGQGEGRQARRSQHQGGPGAGRRGGQGGSRSRGTTSCRSSPKSGSPAQRPPRNRPKP